MTVIVGIKYPKGIVMASDLLMTDSKGGNRTECKKLYYKNGIIVGYSGDTYSSEVMRELGKRLQNFFSRHSVDSLVESELGRFNRDFNNEMKADALSSPLGELELRLHLEALHLEALVASFSNGAFRLWYDSGAGILVPMNTHHILSPDAKYPKEFYSEARATKEMNAQQAIELAIRTVKKHIDEKPNFFSGMEVVQMTKDGVRQAAYERVSQ